MDPIFLINLHGILEMLVLLLLFKMMFLSTSIEVCWDNRLLFFLT